MAEDQVIRTARTVTQLGAKKSLQRLINRALTKVVRRTLSLPGFGVKIRLAEWLLEDCGFGSGGNIYYSNERAVFELIKCELPLLIDVGAHCGEYTNEFLDRFHQGRALCFEPVEKHFMLLRTAVRTPDRVKFFQMAISNFEGESVIFRDKPISGLASLSRRNLEHFSISMDIEEQVPVTTLDTFAVSHRIHHVDLLKLDVEGHELNVLKGASGLLASGKIGVIQFEFGGCNLDTRTTFQDFYYFLTGYNFTIYVIHKRGLYRLDRYKEIYEQYRTTNFVAMLQR